MAKPLAFVILCGLCSWKNIYGGHEWFRILKHNNALWNFTSLGPHLANIQQFLLKVRQTRFLRNSICLGNSREIPFTRDSDSTPNSPGIPPCVWCTTEWHHINTKQKSRLLVGMTQSHAMNDFRPFFACCSQDNAATSTPSASLFS